jgi:NADPH:quinone reductase-like Zn-dependent oxidoreductase
LTCLRIGASLVNPCSAPALHRREYIMPEFKQLSRSVKGLTVLVTGAASGMGRATALIFAAEGAHVAVTDLNAEATQAVTDEIIARGGSADRRRRI